MRKMPKSPTHKMHGQIKSAKTVKETLHMRQPLQKQKVIEENIREIQSQLHKEISPKKNKV